EAGRRSPDASLANAVAAVRGAVGDRPADDLLDAFADAFPGVEPPEDARLEDLFLVHLANENPAADPLRPLVDEGELPPDELAAAIAALEARLGSVVVSGGPESAATDAEPGRPSGAPVSL